MKTCTKCGETRPLEMFSKSVSRKDGKQNQCKSCNRAYAQARQAANPERLREMRRAHCAAHPEMVRNRRLLCAHRISLADYNRMLEAQDGVCAICKRSESQMVSGKTKNLAVDHDHKTGKIRGLLCSACNTSLGKLKEDPALLRGMVTYIHTHYPEGIIASIKRSA